MGISFMVATNRKANGLSKIISADGGATWLRYSEMNREEVRVGFGALLSLKYFL